ncbi:helix-turn-helix domain-containing protein [Rhodococcus sp. 06-1460-1B]|uniref:helix-turn-helix domain-containing protein n=1 Tax=Rhodococcus sp. 06-1460-1B TaxID=2022501 RepID=UPI000B9C0A7A|nr:helix-turn-helix domain-containing protein [Rhodococcus sp. 06-1460-1B]OZD57411.1 hypothetical protein CH268_20195 [Rhodococcus sp. 06-1460-1B]
MPTSPNDSLSRSAFRAITEVNDGSPVSDVAERFGVSRQTVTAWRKRYENSGIDGLVDSSRRPHASPNRIQPDIEALICEMRRHHRRWGARRICFELSKESETEPHLARPSTERSSATAWSIIKSNNINESTNVGSAKRRCTYGSSTSSAECSSSADASAKC